MTSAKPRCLDIHAYHVGKPLVDRITTDGAQHGIKIVKSEDGATRIEVGGRLTGMPLIPLLSVGKVAPGSDYPFPLRDPDPVNFINKNNGLSDNQRRAVCWDTGAALLGIK